MVSIRRTPGVIGLVRAEHSRLYAFQMYIKEAKSEPEK